MLMSLATLSVMATTQAVSAQQDTQTVHLYSHR